MKLNRRTVIIAGIAVALVAAALFFVSRAPNDEEIDGGPSIGTSSRFALPPPVTTSTLPRSERIVIPTPGGVNLSVRNFYLNPAVPPTATDVFLIENERYAIDYFRGTGGFAIFITASPFDTVRAEAEQAFLAALGITQSQACTLSVTVGVPFSVDPDRSGQIYPLSFCEKIL